MFPPPAFFSAKMLPRGCASALLAWILCILGNACSSSSTPHAGSVLASDQVSGSVAAAQARQLRAEACTEQHEAQSAEAQGDIVAALTHWERLYDTRFAATAQRRLAALAMERLRDQVPNAPLSAAGTWRILTFIYRNVDADWVDSAGVTQHFTRRYTDADVAAMQREVERLAPLVDDWSDGSLHLVMTTRVIDEPIHDLPMEYYIGMSTPRIEADAASVPAGQYETIMAVEPGDKAMKSYAGLSLLGTEIKGAGVIKLKNHNPAGTGTGFAADEAIVHELLHWLDYTIHQQGYPSGAIGLDPHKDSLTWASGLSPNYAPPATPWGPWAPTYKNRFKATATRKMLSELPLRGQVPADVVAQRQQWLDGSSLLPGRYSMKLIGSPGPRVEGGTNLYESISLRFEALHAGDYEVSLSMFQQKAGDENAKLHLTVAGLDDVIEVPDTAPATFRRTVHIAEPGTYSLNAKFINDFWIPGTSIDRNLLVQWLAVTDAPAGDRVLAETLVAPGSVNSDRTAKVIGSLTWPISVQTAGRYTVSTSVHTDAETTASFTLRVAGHSQEFTVSGDALQTKSFEVDLPAGASVAEFVSDAENVHPLAVDWLDWGMPVALEAPVCQ